MSKTPVAEPFIGASTTGRTPHEHERVRAFAQKLHELMLAKGWSQSDLAREVWGTDIDRRGYTVAKNRDRVSAYLRGTTIPEASNLAKIAEVFGVPVQELAPDVAVSSVDRAHPALRLTMVAGHADKAHLQVDQLVPMTVAAQIIALLSGQPSKD